MEQILSQAMERLSNPEVLFGLAVRFFGVFIVLIIVMGLLFLTGWFFQKLEERDKEAARSAPADPTPSPPPASPPKETPTEAASASAGSEVPDEVAIAIALAMVPDEVAVAVAMALNETVEQGASVPLLSVRETAPTGWEQPGSAWKIVGRQQALFQKTSLSRDITPKGE